MITAIMPLKHHHPTYLDEALQSLYSQSCGDWRLIVVHDPEDREGSRRQLDRHLTDSRVEVIVNEGVRLAGAINTGMRAATSQFVALLFADDRWEPAAVEVLEHRIAESPLTDFFHSSRIIIDDDGATIGVQLAPAEVDPEDFREGSPVEHLLCWRRQAGLSVGGLDESIGNTGPDDWDFTWTMAERGMTFTAIDEPLYAYRDHRSAPRLTTHMTRDEHVANIRRILRKHGVPEHDIAAIVARARSGYLRQSQYRSAADRRVRQLLRRPPREWRDDYG